MPGRVAHHDSQCCQQQVVQEPAVPQDYLSQACPLQAGLTPAHVMPGRVAHHDSQCSQQQVVQLARQSGSPTCPLPAGLQLVSSQSLVTGQGGQPRHTERAQDAVSCHVPAESGLLSSAQHPQQGRLLISECQGQEEFVSKWFESYEYIKSSHDFTNCWKSDSPKIIVFFDFLSSTMKLIVQQEYLKKDTTNKNIVILTSESDEDLQKKMRNKLVFEEKKTACSLVLQEKTDYLLGSIHLFKIWNKIDVDRKSFIYQSLKNLNDKQKIRFWKTFTCEDKMKQFQTLNALAGLEKVKPLYINFFKAESASPGWKICRSLIKVWESFYQVELRTVPGVKVMKTTEKFIFLCPIRFQDELHLISTCLNIESVLSRLPTHFSLSTVLWGFQRYNKNKHIKTRSMTLLLLKATSMMENIQAKSNPRREDKLFFKYFDQIQKVRNEAYSKKQKFNLEIIQSTQVCPISR